MKYTISNRLTGVLARASTLYNISSRGKKETPSETDACKADKTIAEAMSQSRLAAQLEELSPRKRFVRV